MQVQTLSEAQTFLFKFNIKSMNKEFKKGDYVKVSTSNGLYNPYWTDFVETNNYTISQFRVYLNYDKTYKIYI